MLGHKWRLQLFLIQKHEWYDFSTVFGIRAKGNETLICSCAVMEVVDRIRRLCLFYRLTLTDSKKIGQHFVHCRNVRYQNQTGVIQI